MSTSVTSVVPSVSGWVSGVLVVAVTGVGRVCIRRERYVDLRVLVRIGVRVDKRLVLFWLEFWLEGVLLFWPRFDRKRCGGGERGGESAACICG